jgi:ribose transport system ATP-binding protein
MRLSIERVSKSFPSVRALDNVSMEFSPGEIHALMGENGAGKSTLIKIMTGVHRPDAGDIKLDGATVSFGSPRDALAAGIGAVHQERNLIPRFSVGENILLEHLPLRYGLVDYAAVDKRSREVLDLLDPDIETRAEVSGLSVAQMQLVEIAKALSLDARVLLLDEPTASITNHEAAALFAVLRRLKADGVAIVFVSHKLDEVMAISDRVSVLRDGRIAASNEPIAAMTRGRLVSLMIGREERTAQISRGYHSFPQKGGDSRTLWAGRRRTDGVGAGDLRRGADHRRRTSYSREKRADRRPLSSLEAPPHWPCQRGSQVRRADP